MYNSEKLPDNWIINFLKSINTNSNILAVELALEDIKEGKTISELFLKENGFGFFIKTKESNNKYKYIIEFGCLVAPLAGDGGEWYVQFDEKGHVININEVSRWIC